MQEKIRKKSKKEHGSRRRRDLPPKANPNPGRGNGLEEKQDGKGDGEGNENLSRFPAGAQGGKAPENYPTQAPAQSGSQGVGHQIVYIRCPTGEHL